MDLPPKNLYNKRFENMSIFKIWFTSIQAGNTACNYSDSLSPRVIAPNLLKSRNLLRYNSLTV